MFLADKKTCCLLSARNAILPHHSNVQRLRRIIHKSSEHVYCRRRSWIESTPNASHTHIGQSYPMYESRVHTRLLCLCVCSVYFFLLLFSVNNEPNAATHRPQEPNARRSRIREKKNRWEIVYDYNQFVTIAIWQLDEASTWRNSECHRATAMLLFNTNNKSAYRCTIHRQTVNVWIVISNKWLQYSDTVTHIVIVRRWRTYTHKHAFNVRSCNIQALNWIQTERNTCACVALCICIVWQVEEKSCTNTGCFGLRAQMYSSRHRRYVNRWLDGIYCDLYMLHTSYCCVHLMIEFDSMCLLLCLYWSSWRYLVSSGSLCIVLPVRSFAGRVYEQRAIAPLSACIISMYVLCLCVCLIVYASMHVSFAGSA